MKEMLSYYQELASYVRQVQTEIGSILPAEQAEEVNRSLQSLWMKVQSQIYDVIVYGD